MARKENLQYLMLKELAEMYDRGKGKSKRSFKTETERLRREARTAGATYKETLYIDTAKNYIFSQSTFDNYKKHCRYFCNFLQDKGIKKISIEESRQYIQEYIEYLEKERHWSAFSINLSLSAVVKVTHSYLCDYTHPVRCLANQTRGRKEAVHDKYNEKHCERTLKANRLLGLRRNALLNLKCENIKMITTPEGKEVLEVHIKSKGGRMNIQSFYLDEEKETILSWIKDKKPTDYIFDREEIKKHDADYHSCRAKRAKEVYYRVLDDLKEHPEKRAEYRQEIERIFARDGKKLKENLDHPYYARGTFRKYLEEKGYDVKMDRLAVIFVSVTCLAHNRSDTTVEHYLCT